MDASGLKAGLLKTNKIKSSKALPVDVKSKKRVLLGKYNKSEDEDSLKTVSDVEELKKTEQEVTTILNVELCIVHKGPIKGANYACPKCNTTYCLNCAATLANKGESCWSCGNKIELDPAVRTLFSS